MIAPLRVGFVTGATPDKWARSWRAGRRESLHLVQTTEAEQVDGVQDGSLDMAIVRLPVDQDGLHCVRLYDELQVAVASREHLLAAADDEVTTADLDDEQLLVSAAVTLLGRLGLAKARKDAAVFRRGGRGGPAGSEGDLGHLGGFHLSGAAGGRRGGGLRVAVDGRAERRDENHREQ